MHRNLSNIPLRKKKKKFVGQVGESAEMPRKTRVTAFPKENKENAEI